MARIIDADGHIVEPRKLWEEYVEPEFRDRVIRIERSREGLDEFWINGERRRGPGGSIVASVIPGGYLSAERTRAATWEDILPGSWDPHARIKVLDEEGIDIAFLYPSFYLIYGDHEDPRLAVAACRAYNNWMADFCHPYPKRLHGVAPMPIQDVGAAVTEMRRVVKELNFKAVFIRPNPYNHRRLNDAVYDIFWREAEELDIPVAVHSSFGTKMPALGADRYLQDTFSFHMVCHPFEQQAACMDVICGGVLERFPKLRVAFLEAGGGMGRLLARSHGWPLREDGIDGAMAQKTPERIFPRAVLFIARSGRTHARRDVRSWSRAQHPVGLRLSALRLHFSWRGQTGRGRGEDSARDGAS
jgi:predicted TIM-barrel fold metal-dependent hydrolase